MSLFTCPQCHGVGSRNDDGTDDIIFCPLCGGSGWVEEEDL